MTLNEQSATAITAAVTADMPTVLRELETLVRIPGIAFPGFPENDVDRAREETVRVLRDAGFPEVRVLPIDGGSDAVLAEIAGPVGSPTVLLYAHFDVQPAGDEQAWQSPPFEPTVRNGRLYGRGAADDKSGVVIHAGVLRALLTAGDGIPPCTIRVIVEGDEESGGSLETIVAAHRDELAADAIVVADVGNLRIGEPTFTTALRGLAEVFVEIRTLEQQVHSGLFGGPAPDALMALITTLASLRDANGDTVVDGLSGFDWDGPEYPADLYRDLAGVVDEQPLIGTGAVSSRLFSRPVANVIGIDAPRVEGAINAVIPFARAKVSLRVPPGVDPTQAQVVLIAHLERAVPWGVHAEITGGAVGRGVRVSTDGPAYEAARRAMKRAYERDAQEIGSGGSIPLIDELRSQLPDAEILLFGAQDPAARIHAPNESVDLAELQRAVLAEALFIAEFASDS
ncbi:MAG: M20/M25/M40 family metallo-hydrolase [Actinobacteria bacterium]|nr:M20/M25/M40 family metallo-hydrolase [Actinomycetota bacterium]